MRTAVTMVSMSSPVAMTMKLLRALELLHATMAQVQPLVIQAA